MIMVKIPTIVLIIIATLLPKQTRKHLAMHTLELAHYKKQSNQREASKHPINPYTNLATLAASDDTISQLP